MRKTEYLRPRTVDEALEIFQRTPGARYLAGGTDLLVKMQRRIERPDALISLRGIEELRRIEPGEPFRIGAAVTVAEMARHPELSARFPLLLQGARALGSPQIRQVATVGGNLCNCSPCADTAPALLVYGARLELRGPAGKRQLPMGEFMRGPGQSCLQPGELLCGVLLDPSPVGAKTIYIKKGRVKVDLALASLAALVVVEKGKLSEVRLAAGSVAPTCLRLGRAEDVLRGKTLDEELLARAARAAAGEISPIDDVRASAEYRRRLIEVFLRRALDGLGREGAA